VVVIYPFVGSIMNLCNCCYLDSTRLMCMLRRAYFAWWAFPKRNRANYGVMAIIRKVPIFGASQYSCVHLFALSLSSFYFQF
jgi:hypothetical protein